MNLEKFYINGEWVDPKKSETIDIINPADETIIGKLNVGSSEDIDRAVKAATSAFPSYSQTSVKDRLDLITTIRNIYKKRFDEIAEAIMTEMGAPTRLPSGSQAMVGLGHLKTAIRVLWDHNFEYEHNGYTVRHEPIGVCGLITPWNWPINQIVSKLGPSGAST